MRKIIELGETLRLYTEYDDLITGDPLDPPVLNCTIRKPDGTSSTITYPHEDFVREAAGLYFIRIEGTQIGTWYYRIYAEVNADDRDVRDGKFDVEPSL
jgi:hypothetical protein